jgi:hypothetical protein
VKVFGGILGIVFDPCFLSSVLCLLL